MDLEAAGKRSFLQLNELDEFRLHAYENSKLYKEKIKRWYDKRIQSRHFEPGQKVLLFNFKIKWFSEKLKSRWPGLFKVVKVTPYSAIELRTLNGERTFMVNGQRVKYYWGDVIHHQSKVLLSDDQARPCIVLRR
ncbi:uncharacterized protein LOC107773184 [Nicotiana tabacum]|uniref:Uncharacterized protein LOC107773184 n=1 Tax=Nicotiana tabacum TaxID=4097 RepID=A0A1S3Y7G9_TOBAC|nr:PREDICTED: uncharacterized protein LOC107773184 [Nicotiana tabacum]